VRPWQALYLLPEPQGHLSLRPTFSPARWGVESSGLSPPDWRARLSSRSFFFWNSRSRASMVVEGVRVGTTGGSCGVDGFWSWGYAAAAWRLVARGIR